MLDYLVFMLASIYIRVYMWKSEQLVEVDFLFLACGFQASNSGHLAKQKIPSLLISTDSLYWFRIIKKEIIIKTKEMVQSLKKW